MATTLRTPARCKAAATEAKASVAAASIMADWQALNHKPKFLLLKKRILLR
jgi:hypothetical protein